MATGKARRYSYKTYTEQVQGAGVFVLLDSAVDIDTTLKTLLRHPWLSEVVSYYYSPKPYTLKGQNNENTQPAG